MNENNPIENTSKSIVDLFKAYYKYSSLTLTQRLTVLSVSAIIFLIFFTLSSLAFLYLGFAFGYWLGEYFDSPKMGFFIVSGIFFLLILICIIIRKALANKLKDIIVRKIYNGNEKD